MLFLFKNILHFRRKDGFLHRQPASMAGDESILLNRAGHPKYCEAPTRVKALSGFENTYNYLWLNTS
jgi:hypothetical protein